MRVGGRLKHAPIPYQAKHPAILPKKHDIVPLILLHLHQRQNHSGVEHILAELRQRFGIKVRSALKKISKSCHVCIKHNAKPDPPLMASLPQSRLQAFTPPFYNTGVDYFGPLLVKERRSAVKHYGCLFTCLVTRAVHLEIAHSLETDSFYIMALRRMMARRGKPRNIYSDNGTNFLGAERELKEYLDGMDQAKISDTLSQDRIQWFFNPPSAPHFGGV